MESGQSSIGTIDKDNAKANRREPLIGIDTKPGKDRDEFPPAMFDEGDKGYSVKHIYPSNNRGAGSTMGHDLRGLPDGTRVEITVE